MRDRLVLRSAVLTLLGFLFTAVSSTAQTVTIFTVPGAQQTRAFGINPSGDIVGIYLVNATIARGFRLARTASR